MFSQCQSIKWHQANSILLWTIKHHNVSLNKYTGCKTHVKSVSFPFFSRSSHIKRLIKYFDKTDMTQTLNATCSYRTDVHTLHSHLLLCLSLQKQYDYMCFEVNKPMTAWPSHKPTFIFLNMESVLKPRSWVPRDWEPSVLVRTSSNLPDWSTSKMRITAVRSSKRYETIRRHNFLHWSWKQQLTPNRMVPNTTQHHTLPSWKKRKSSNRADIRTRYLSNIGLECHRYNNLQESPIMVWLIVGYWYVA
jgi:hypothetical protein